MQQMWSDTVSGLPPTPIRLIETTVATNKTWYPAREHVDL